MSGNNEILYDYLSLYRQHLNTIQSFINLNNNIIIVLLIQFLQLEIII